MVRHNLFLALKEAINNAAKHANASRVLVQVFMRANELEILISDNGSGFETAKAMNAIGFSDPGKSC
jgi:signal transduction histidine kinase